MSILDGILALGEAFTKGVISSAESYSKNNKLSVEQREYYGELVKGLTVGLGKIDEYRDSSKKIKPLETGRVKREPYTTADLKAMALMEPYFGFIVANMQTVGFFLTKFRLMIKMYMRISKKDVKS